MTALNITAAELSQARVLANQGNLADVWKILADRGDAYAYLAQYVIASVARMKRSRMRGFVAPIIPDYALHPGYAGFVPQHILWPLLCLFLTVFCCQQAAAKGNKPPVFELYQITPLCLGCLKDCANFTIKIYADGRVHYHGQKTVSRYRLHQAVRVLGDRYGKITKAQVAELAKTFESFPLEDIERANKRFGNQVGGGVIKYKTDTQDLRINFIPFFDVMTTKLNGFVNIEKWICFPKGHIEHDRCLLNYYPTYEGF
jgi:hypothetical protein